MVVEWKEGAGREPADNTLRVDSIPTDIRCLDQGRASWGRERDSTSGGGLVIIPGGCRSPHRVVEGELGGAQEGCRGEQEGWVSESWGGPGHFA